MELKQFISKERERITLLALDPGETTGVCLFSKGEFVSATELNTKSLHESVELIKSLILSNVPDLLVYEDYRIYGWKSDTHKWANLHTPKLIGCIVTLCELLSVAHCTRMAGDVKKFVDDEKLKAWRLWTKGSTHARDATRHAVYELIHPTHGVKFTDRKLLGTVD